MNELQGQRAEIDTKLNNQLNIANQIDSQGVATNEANVLKTQFENQIAELIIKLKNMKIRVSKSIINNFLQLSLIL